MEISVTGRIAGVGGVTVLSLEEPVDPELVLRGVVDSGVAFFLVMLRARIGPSVAVLLIEFCLPISDELEGIWMRMGSRL